MRAIVLDNFGDEDVLHIGDAPSPACGPHDLRIRVRATAVNRADLLQRRGHYPPPPGASELLGLECAGEVIEAGPQVTGWKKGDRAMALLPGGGYAEEAVVDAGSAMHVPDALTDEEAGGFPEVFLTAHSNVFVLGGATKGSAVLIHGGGSGVGTAAILLCREIGARAIATAGSDDKCQRCIGLGAVAAVNYKTADFVEAVRNATGGAGADVILDHMGGEYLGKDLQALRKLGRIVMIGTMGGAKGQLDIDTLLMKRATIIGSTLRGRSVEEKADVVRRFVEQFGDALNAGRLRPVIDRVFPLAQAAGAHRYLASSAHFGKVILKV